MKNVFVWIDNQMKQAALLPEEEQPISVWYYLSQLQPITRESELFSDINDTAMADVDDSEKPDGDIGLDETNFLDDEDEFNLNLSDYLDDDDSLSASEYLDDDDYRLSGSDYLDEEDDFSINESDDQEAKFDETDNVGAKRREIHDVKKDTKAPVLVVNRYMAGSLVPENKTDHETIGFFHEKSVFTTRTLIDFISKKQHRAQFLSTFLTPYWDKAFPYSVSFNEWLDQFDGELYVSYSPHFTIHIGSAPLTMEGVPAFTTMRTGTVKIGVPFPTIFYYTWRFTLLSTISELSNQKRIVYLVGERLAREEFEQLNQVPMKQVIIHDTNESMFKSQKERLERLPSVSKVYALSSLSFDELYSGWNFLNEDKDRTDVKSSMKRTIDIPVYLRMKVNNWAEKEGALDVLLDILNTTIGEMCNEWWLEYSPEDVDIVKKMLEVGKCYQTKVIPFVQKNYKKSKRYLFDFKKKDWETKQGFFIQIEKALLPIYEVLNGDKKGV